MSTIAAVEGETHTGTLVLETHPCEYDLQKAMGYILARGPRKAPRPRLKEHLFRLYVAKTRPTNLLCSAMCKSHLSSDQQLALGTQGWNVVNL